MQIKLLILLLFFFSALTLRAQEICGNGIDDDSDGLVDLRDPDCKGNSHPIIQNPSFERIHSCPDKYSQLHFANNWQQPSGNDLGSTDLYHSCGTCNYTYNTFLTNIPFPIPDGEGFAGFFDIRQWNNNGSYKEHLTTCLNEVLEKDSNYIFDFSLGFITPLVGQGVESYISFSPINISLFGHPSCSSLPYGQLNDTAYKSCPIDTDREWVELGKVAVSGTPGNWVTARLQFKAPKNIKALVFGPSCEVSPHGSENEWGFYVADQLLLYKKEMYDIPTILKTGDICADTLKLQAVFDPGPLAQYQWFKNKIALNGEVSQTLILTRSRFGEGDYNVLATISGKTYLSPETIVKINEVSFTLADTMAFCKNDELLLQPEISSDNSGCPISYLWQDGSPTKTLRISSPGIYWFETDKNGCRLRDSIYIIEHAVPQVNLGNDTTICENHDFFLDAANPGLEYLWQNNINTQSLRVTDEGNYHVAVSNEFCTGSDTIKITLNKIPSVSFQADTIICTGEQKILQPEVNGQNYLWSDGSTLPTLSINEPGIYSVLVTNNCGSTSQSVRIDRGDCIFYLPSAFTPNGDGLNDAFGLVDYSFIRDYNFRIYNRYGQIVFHTNDPSKKWNGKLKGAQASTGSYVWSITYTDWRKRPFHHNGSVLLIR